MEQRFTLEQWRKIRGYSQEKMAELCGVHINTYRMWEQNPSSIKLGKALEIAEILGITVDDIIFLP